MPPANHEAFSCWTLRRIGERCTRLILILFLGPSSSGIDLDGGMAKDGAEGFLGHSLGGLSCDRNVLDVDRVAPDAHAGRMPDRVGDRADRAGDADLADALHPERVDIGIVFMDEDRLH